jgi:site-specific DNA recombinase
LAELATRQRQLESQLARDHGEIARLAAQANPGSATTTRMADLHQRIGQSELELTGVKHRTTEIAGQQIREADVAAAIGDFDNIWNALSSREQAQVLALLVARVEFDFEDSTLAISFHPSAIKTLAESHMEDAA